MRKFVVAASAAAALSLLFATPAPAQTGDATVTVLHGIPNTPVDVYVNDALTLDNFAYETVTQPLSLRAGPYNVKIRAADSPATGPVILQGDVTLPAGANASLIAHLSAAGQPALTPFVNDVSPVAAGQGRLVVRHTAAAPAVDVLAGGTPVFRNLSNPNQASADLPAGTVSASVAATGTTQPVIGPANVPVVEGQATIVYAVGSLSGGNLGVLVQTISGLHSAPSAVAGGNSGLADVGTPTPWATYVLVSFGAMAAATAGLGLARRRSA